MQGIEAQAQDLAAGQIRAEKQNGKHGRRLQRRRRSHFRQKPSSDRRCIHHWHHFQRSNKNIAEGRRYRGLCTLRSKSVRRLWTVDCGLWTVDCCSFGVCGEKLQIEFYLLNAGKNARAQNCPLSTVHSPQSTVHCPLSTVHSPLSTVHSPLSTVHYRSRDIGSITCMP